MPNNYRGLTIPHRAARPTSSRGARWGFRWRPPHCRWNGENSREGIKSKSPQALLMADGIASRTMAKESEGKNTVVTFRVGHGNISGLAL